MTTDLHPAQVRDIVARTFRDYGVDVEDRLDLNETLRIDRGRLAARCFRAGGLMAMWLIEVGLLQFYDGDGNMLRTVNLFQYREPQRFAA